MMSSVRMLPAALLALILASPVFAAPTSENNPFRAIAALAPRKPEPPVCCLKLLQPLEEQEDEVLLSFEEWKSKQAQLEKSKGKDAASRSAHTGNGHHGGKGNGSDNLTEVVDAGTSEEVPAHDEALPVQPPEVEVLSPHFRVPLQGRFNYANSDCSARVHRSHRSAKSSSAILSSKRDRYMLSPCVSPTREPHFVVVELCEDIAIDTVQLANFEFFSGVFKDFKVSVTKTDFTKPAQEWTDAGTFRAKNVRGVQSFTLPKTLRDFYRYIRIDFLSHYGGEYYCPISLLRVYGLTHLEQWKWDEWAAQSTPIAQPIHDTLPPPTGVIGGDASPEAAKDAEHKYPSSSIPQPNVSISIHIDENSSSSSRSSVEQPSTSAEASSAVPNMTTADGSTATPALPRVTPPPVTVAEPTQAEATSSSVRKNSSVSAPQAHSTETPLSPPKTTVVTSPVIISTVQHQPNVSANGSSITFSATVKSKPQTASVVSSSTTPIIISAGASSVVHTTGGESIYRTIMNRITALENNHTLYALYLGEQMDGVREKLRRLGEDVGRLEGITRGQAQSYHRTLQQWEKQQSELQRDYRELLSKVDHLSGEIVLEKRLGIAQLCLLLAVLVFMGLTRGSRSEHIQLGRRSNYAMMRDWSRRHLRLSGDWAGKLVRSRTRSGDSIVTGDTSQRSSIDYDHEQSARGLQKSAEQLELQPMRNDSASPSKVAFPEKSSPKRRPLETTDVNSRQNKLQSPPTIYAHYNPSLKSRSRTPSRRQRGHPSQTHIIYSQNQAPHTPTHPIQPLAGYSTGYARPRMQRSNSHGGGGLNLVTSTGHRTTKRWGRVAHLHDLRLVDIEKRAKRRSNDLGGNQQDSQDTDEDVFGSAAAKKRSTLGMYECKAQQPVGRGGVDLDAQSPSEEGPSPISPGGEGDGDQWVDTDTDEEETWDTLKHQVTPPKSGPSNGNEH